MAINFPSNPILDQIYSEGQRQWKWNGRAWELDSSLLPIGPTGPRGYSGSFGYTGSQGATGPTGEKGVSLLYQDTPPLGSVYNQWFDTATGKYYIYVVDDDSAQWVEISNQGVIGYTGSQGNNFTLYKTYSSYNELLNETDPYIPNGSFAIISSNDSDNGNLYKWDSQQQEFVYILNQTGDPGPTGPTGPRGKSIEFKGEIEGEIELPLYPNFNDAYLNTNTGNLHVWNGTTWVVGKFTGDLGPTGPQGYQITLSSTPPSNPEHGFEWINSETGIKYTWIEDGDPMNDSGQWVELAGSINYGPTGPTGLQGDPGPTGPAGDPVIIRGEVTSLPELPESPNFNDAYINSSNGELYVWDGSQWYSAGRIKGDYGPTGPTGPVGASAPKSISIPYPTASENVTLFYTAVGINLTEIRVVLKGYADPAVGLRIFYGNDRSSGTAVTTAQVTNSTTTGNSLILSTSFIPSNSYLWVVTNQLFGTVEELSITLIF